MIRNSQVALDYLKGILNSYEQRKRFTDIFSISPESLAAWFKYERFPEGLNLIRLSVALKYLGYADVELHSDQAFAEITEAIAFDIISIEDVNNVLGFCDTSGLRRVLINNAKTSTVRLGLAEELVDSIQPELQQRRYSVQLLCSEITQAGVTLVSEFLEPNGPAKSARSYVGREVQQSFRTYEPTEVLTPDGINPGYQQYLLFETFAGLLKAAEPMLEYFNDADPELRRELRAHIGYLEISRIAELFRNIASEKYKEMQSARNRPKGS